MLSVEQQKHEGIRTCGPKDDQVDRTSCDPQALKLKDRVEARDTSRERDEDDHCPGHVLVHVF